MCDCGGGTVVLDACVFLQVNACVLLMVRVSVNEFDQAT